MPSPEHIELNAIKAEKGCTITQAALAFLEGRGIATTASAKHDIFCVIQWVRDQQNEDTIECVRHHLRKELQDADSKEAN